jgi:DNA-binding beta-propeller fold protein YncE
MANGSFVVGAPVASGQTYDVTVVGSSYACNVVPNTGFGTVGAAPVMSVQIQCGDLAPTQTGDVTGVASDGTNVYWANYTNGSIYSEPVVGGTITTLYSGSQGMGPTGLAIYPATGASVVFWTNSSNGNVMRVTTGANSVVKLIASGPTGATGIAVSPSGNVVYWTNRTSGSVVAASAAGGGTTTTLSTGNNLPTAVVADAANLYWTNFGDATVAGSGGVWRIALGPGGLASTDANGTAEIAKGTTPLGIAVYGANVYWTDPGVGTVWTAPTSATTTGNTAPTPIAMGQLAPWYIATDGTYVYWTCHSTVGTVERALIGGGAGVAPTPLAQNQSSPNFIAVDATNVYWTNDNPSPNGQVDEVPKN